MHSVSLGTARTALRTSRSARGAAYWKKKRCSLASCVVRNVARCSRVLIVESEAVREAWAAAHVALLRSVCRLHVGGLCELFHHQDAPVRAGYAALELFAGQCASYGCPLNLICTE